jgi:hypothetical protein
MHGTFGGPPAPPRGTPGTFHFPEELLRVLGPGHAITGVDWIAPGLLGGPVLLGMPLRRRHRGDYGLTYSGLFLTTPHLQLPGSTVSEPPPLAATSAAWSPGAAEAGTPRDSLILQRGPKRRDRAERLGFHATPHHPT